MKRFCMLILALFMMLAVLYGCHQNTTNDDKINIVSTTFPQYDWVRQILGDESANIELTLLIDNKADLHSFQPSVEDIAKVSSCDLFIYVGGESDAWVEGALKSATNQNMIVINLLEILGDLAKEEEIIAGMEHEHEHDNEHEDKAEYDEHVWLSLKNAAIFCPIIADALSTLNPEKAALYESNLAAYTEKLSALDEAYQSIVDTAPVKTLLFGDRFPFRYLVDDYGLDYYAAFSGCSAETEASFETIIFLATKIDELSLNNIMVTESSDQSMADTIKNNTRNKNQQIQILDSMQSVSRVDIANGMTYLAIMEQNLHVLKDGLK